MEELDKLQTENTLKMMQNLLDFERSQFEELNKQLKVEQTSILQLKDHPDFKKFEEKLQKQVEQHKE